MLRNFESCLSMLVYWRVFASGLTVPI